MICHHPLLTCTVVVTVNHFKSPHSMYYNILTGLQTGFRVKIVNFLQLCCLTIPRRDLSTKKTKYRKMTRKPQSHWNFNISNVGY